MSANRWAAPNPPWRAGPLQATSSAIEASVGSAGGPRSGRIASEQFFDDGSEGITVRFRRRGGRQRDEGGSMDLFESFVEGYGQDVFLGLLQWQQALQVAVEIERVVVSAQREVAQPEVLDGQLSPDACGLAQAVAGLGVHDGGSGRTSGRRGVDVGGDYRGEQFTGHLVNRLA